LDIGVLINNVGMSYAYPEFLSYLPDASAFCTRLMHCNILSVTGMTLLLLPRMAEKRKGLILNVSSASAVLPSPLLTMYSSCKVKLCDEQVHVASRKRQITMEHVVCWTWK
jgi:17beta-estradiol 17-dehydrogenase / very-long-chain 3-oxoacyl-CoA reductase